MLFDFEQMTPMQCFEFHTGTVVPRPIALITTQSPEGMLNAAPYSFFNIMGLKPPVVPCTVLPSTDGGMKDTGNILATRELVVNLVSEQMAEAMNVTCIDAPANVEELSGRADDDAVQQSDTPRIEASPVTFECVLPAEVPLTTNQFIAIGRIVQAHVVDKFVLDAPKHLFDTPALRLIGAMHAAKWYSRTSDRFCNGSPNVGGVGQTTEVKTLRWLCFSFDQAAWSKQPDAMVCLNPTHSPVRSKWSVGRLHSRTKSRCPSMLLGRHSLLRYRLFTYCPAPSF